ncbi:MAG TPA: hypothetical protein VJ802_05705 [Gemmatimonadaceae bacterium]|nr:hypothetical protein [Gemmatimonadaceae bacterium]
MAPCPRLPSGQEEAVEVLRPGVDPGEHAENLNPAAELTWRGVRGRGARGRVPYANDAAASPILVPAIRAMDPLGR